MSVVQTKPSVVVEYVRMQSVLHGIDQGALEKFRSDVSLEFQGEAAEMSQDIPTLDAVIAFGIAYGVADEVALRQNDGGLVLLFDHEPTPVLRPNGVDETIWNEIARVKKKITLFGDVACPSPEATVDLRKAWADVQDADLSKRVKSFVKKLAQTFSPAIRITVQGEIPHLPLLSAIYIARLCGRDVYHETDDGKRVAIFQ